MNQIRDAIEIVRGHHTKKVYSDGVGNYCGLGAVIRAFGYNYSNEMDHEDAVEWEEMSRVMGDVAKEQYPLRTKSNYFPNFNDHPLTTEEEVIAVMDKAAVVWDELKGL